MPKKSKKPQKVILTFTDSPTGFTVELEFRPSIRADSPPSPAVHAAHLCVKALKAAAEEQ